MHHYVWHWTYTVEALVVLLGIFFLVSVALLLASALSNRRQRHTRRSVRVPYGSLGYRDIELERMSKRGLERARSRQYHIKGRE